MNRRFFFVVASPEVPDKCTVYGVDIRDGIMLLSQKMARGRGSLSATLLFSEAPITKMTLVGERLCFSGTNTSIEGTMVAAFCSLARAERCFLSDELKPSDARWLSDTAEVLYQFETLPGSRCVYGPVVCFASMGIAG